MTGEDTLGMYLDVRPHVRKVHPICQKDMTDMSLSMDAKFPATFACTQLDEHSAALANLRVKTESQDDTLYHGFLVFFLRGVWGWRFWLNKWL